MSEHQAGQGAVYDAFSGTQLDTSKWFFLEMPAPDGSMWKCEEPNAKTSLANGTCTITANPFERFHDVVQTMDNPKHLLLSTASFDIPANGSRRFSVDMSARGIQADRHDYRDAFASFNVLDMSSGIVFDFILSGEHVYAIHEQLPFPPTARPFTHVVEDPLTGVRPVAGESLRCELDFDRAQGLVRWRVDGKEIYRVQGASIPESVKLGFGLFTVHAIHEGRSRSLKGQGLTATWRGFTVSEPIVTQTPSQTVAPKRPARSAAGKSAPRAPAPSRASKRSPAPAKKAAPRAPAKKAAPRAPAKKAAQRAPVSSRTRKGRR